ncbi:15682_t:CDS:1, partial [Cetraspora pellucida]
NIKAAKYQSDRRKKKPKAVRFEIYKNLGNWHHYKGANYRDYDSNYNGDQDNYNIKQQFLKADKLNKKMIIIAKKHENNMYTSKLIDTREIVSEFENFKRNQNLKPSKEVCINYIDSNYSNYIDSNYSNLFI